MIVFLSIPGEPQGKARARTVRNKYTGKSVSFTPDKTVEYEQKIAWTYVQMKHPKLEGPVRIFLKAYFGVPKSWSNKKRQQALDGELRPCKKPDWDNIGKCLDALNTIAWTDDTQIAEACVVKYYSASPRLEIEIEEL